MAAKPKQPKKKMKTLDEFAAAIHADYLTISKQMATKEDILQIRSEMATKEDIRQIRNDMGIGFRDLHADVKMITEVMVSKSDLTEAIREELDKSSFAKEKDVAELRDRLMRVEEKLGMKHGRHAA